MKTFQIGQRVEVNPSRRCGIPCVFRSDGMDLADHEPPVRGRAGTVVDLVPGHRDGGWTFYGVDIDGDDLGDRALAPLCGACLSALPERNGRYGGPNAGGSDQSDEPRR